MKLDDASKFLECIPKEVNFSFAENTTYGSGGTAEIAYFPKYIRQVAFVYNYLVREKINFVILGNGSNILASDKNYDGAVISTKRFGGVFRLGTNRIFCRSGTKVSALLKYCAERGLSGLEYLAGIPASVGGLVYMNGGAGGKVIAQDVVNVKLFDGKIRDFSNNSCQFGHKYSIMRDINGVILGTTLQVEPEKREKVRENIAEFLEKRSLQPKGKSCGCVFKNAGALGAGKIIDEAGLKGLSVGNAKVSSEHANFIINHGENSADVYALVKEVKRRVFERTGIVLEEEVVYIGDF